MLEAFPKCLDVLRGLFLKSSTFFKTADQKFFVNDRACQLVRVTIGLRGKDLAILLEDPDCQYV